MQGCDLTDQVDHDSFIIIFVLKVYMVHWPLFEWHKYWDIGAYAYGRHVTWSRKLVFKII